jgi:predicted nucleic acid-binding protein
MRYLLGANTLTDMLLADSAAGRWLAEVNAADCSLSVIAVAIARSAVQSAPQLSEFDRQRASNTLAQSLQRIVNVAGEPLAVDEKVAQVWSRLRQQPQLEYERAGKRWTVGQDTRLVIATASSYGLTLVEPRERYHAELLRLGIQVHSL